MKRAVLDANVLFPADLRNTLMHLTLARALEARWSHQIHEEWMRNVLKARPDLTRAALERTRRLMDENALDALVEGFEPLIPTLKLPDADDRHVLAAAIHAGAQFIVTWNTKDFPANALRPHGVSAVSPDQFLTDLFAVAQTSMLADLSAQRARLNNPPQTPAQFLDSLARQRLTRFVAALRPFQDQLQ